MIVTLQTAGLQTLAQVRAFVEGMEPVSFTLTDRFAAHVWMPSPQNAAIMTPPAASIRRGQNSFNSSTNPKNPLPECAHP